jgi:hypothetical protein
MVKGRETESPVFAHADARNSVLTGELLEGLHVDAEMSCGFVCCKQWLKSKVYIFHLIGPVYPECCAADRMMTVMTIHRNPESRTEASFSTEGGCWEGIGAWCEF